MIDAADGNMYLGGTFTQPSSFARTGAGLVYLTGTIKDGLALDASSTGDWHLLGGTVYGSTLSETGGAKMIATTSGGTLDGVTIDADVDMTQASNNVNMRIKNSELNGTVFVGGAAGGYARLYIGDNSAAADTLAGTGDIVFGNSGSNTLYNYSSGAGYLTFAW